MAYEGRRTRRPSPGGTRTHGRHIPGAEREIADEVKKAAEPVNTLERKAEGRPAKRHAAARTCPRILSQPAGLANVSKRNRTLGEWATWLPPGDDPRLASGLLARYAQRAFGA
jgi:hypothetical protein